MNRPDGDGQGWPVGPREGLVLPSRRPAMEMVHDALEAGPILLTGDAGVGKTWLWRSLAADSAPGRAWVEVDLTPADDPAAFLRMVAHGLGLAGPAWSRTDLGDHLAERSADGERRILVVEEAHNLSPAVAEEVRVLANRLGRADGFAGLVLVGQTSLARRMSARPLASIEARLAARIHLGPIDADEARDLLAWHRPGSGRSLEEVERAHRDASGNPRRLLRIASSIRPIPTPTRAGIVARVEARPAAPAAPVPAATYRPEPLTGPDRPPLRVEDELIEVGWSPEDSVESEADEEASSAESTGPGIASGEEAVHDHYAALQAWREWADNQGRRAVAEVSPAKPAPPPMVDDEDYDPDPDPDAATPYVRVDGQREFAPFGQLFTRMSRVREPE